MTLHVADAAANLLQFILPAIAFAWADRRRTVPQDREKT